MPRQKQTLHDPRDFHIHDSTNNTITREEADHMRELVFRRWLPLLSGSEFKIVIFIYDRTINYMKRWEYVSIDMLENGVFQKGYKPVVERIKREGRQFWRTLSIQEQSVLDNGDCFVTAPTGLSRRQIINSLKSLEENGYIYRIVNGNHPEIALNPDPMYGFRELLEGR
jgi:hypothetical protein